MKDAESAIVSDKAKKRGIPQLGSLGSGNHFLEIQVVDEIYNEEVAKVFGCSRRNAEYRFRAATGKSILQAIREVRLEKAKSMLMDDSIRLDVVANACGYESTPVFAAFFKTETGHSPRAWRKLNT
jgi:AraC-like DNA-binding protein